MRPREPANPALNTFSFPPYDLYDGVAFWLAGPQIHVGDAFMEAKGKSVKPSPVYGRGAPSASVTETLGGYGQKSLQPRFDHRSLSCMVGTLGVNAYASPCEYGNSYCQVNSQISTSFGIM